MEGMRMGWLEDIAKDGFDDPARVVTNTAVEEVEVGGEKAGRITLDLRVRDMRGKPYVATANVYVPRAFADDPSQRLPVWFACGYQAEAPTVERQLQLGRCVFTSCNPEEGTVFPGSNPLSRGPNADYVLAHLARGARFVDPLAIAYGGGSAGGYATLMAVAEAFPATAAAALGPPVNLGYQVAYFSKVFPRFVADPPTDFPIIAMITAAFSQWPPQFEQAHGKDHGAATYFDHSPVAHVDRVTCPVFVMTSTADFLVPADQFSREVAQITLANPPKHVEIAAEELHDAPRVATRLVDVLGDRADVRMIPLPEGAIETLTFDMTMQTPKKPVDMPDAPAEGKQWLINFLDEGPIVLGATHGRHAVEADFEPFVRKAFDRGIELDQLTPAKLDQLLDRYAGIEWLADGYVHLDEPAAEQADVVRGLSLYCAQSDAHAQRFAELYAAVPESRRILPEVSAR
jgi:hypothetical protein